MFIKKIHGRQILDSRGEPTLECILTLSNDIQTIASVPAGASVGSFEAKELRDNNPENYNGRGVLKAIHALETEIAPLLINKKPDVLAMDPEMLASDGTDNKSHLGGNTILAASIAIIRAQAIVENIELYQLINQLSGSEKPVLPACMFNLINGGKHADSGLAFQEFMVMPEAGSVSRSIECASALHHTLKGILQHQHAGTGVGDEGGFAPAFSGQKKLPEHEALDLLQSAIAQSGLKEVISLCLDVAASSFYDQITQQYQFHQQLLTPKQMIDLYAQLTTTYPIVSIEDGLAEEDWDNWQLMTQSLGWKMQLVGDDLFVTNTARIQRGIDQHIANAVLIKPNQIGTVSQTFQAIKLCKQFGYKTVISHRSGETDDTFIADLAVGCAADQFKGGAPVRGERVTKYNRLMEIEEKLG